MGWLLSGCVSICVSCVSFVDADYVHSGFTCEGFCYCICASVIIINVDLCLYTKGVFFDVYNTLML